MKGSVCGDVGVEWSAANIYEPRMPEKEMFGAMRTKMFLLGLYHAQL